MGQRYSHNDREAVISYIKDMLGGMAQMATASGCDDVGDALESFRETCPVLSGFKVASLKIVPSIEQGLT